MEVVMCVLFLSSADLYSVGYSGWSWVRSSWKERLKYSSLLSEQLCPKCLKFLWDPELKSLFLNH